MVQHQTNRLWHEVMLPKNKLKLSLSLSPSAKTRLAGLESLRQAFSSKMLYDFLTERRLTISDCLERSLKKGEMKQKFHC